MMPLFPAEPIRILCYDALTTLIRIFWGPDIEFCQEVMDGRFAGLLRDVADAFHVDMRITMAEAEDFAGRYESAEALLGDLSEGYISLFVNDINGTPVPLYHSCHAASENGFMGLPAVDMANRIAHHSLAIYLPGNEPADHLAIELEYLYYLLNNGWTTSCSADIQEAMLFCAHSMNGWVGRLYGRIAADGRFPFYAIAARLLCSIVDIFSESAAYERHAASGPREQTRRASALPD